MEAPERTRTALAVRGLRFGFERTPVIDDLDLEVPRGEVYALLGRNGAGKTTTLKLLLGILKPRDGRIEFDGHSVSRVDAQLRARIGYVPQHPKFYPWMRGHELARFVGAFHPGWSADAFRSRAAALHVDDALRVREMSGGTVVKLALAIALSVSPELLILDEPTAGLDPVVRRELLTVLRTEAHAGRTILLSTHEISEAEEVAESVGILHRGKMIHQGSVSSLDAPLGDLFHELTREIE
jgi:ABC-2 type transport system ATP-binding protein